MKRARDEGEVIYLRPPEAGKPRGKRTLLALAVLFVLFLVGLNGVPLYTDYLWFREINFPSVFTKVVLYKSLLFFGFGALFFALLYGNFLLASRHAPKQPYRLILAFFGEEFGERVQKWVRGVVFGTCLFFSLWAGRLSADQWSSALEFLHATPFGYADPLFGNDVSFYLFRLPFLEYLAKFLRITLLLALALVVGIKFLQYSVEDAERRKIEWRQSDLRHLLGLLIALALTQAWMAKLNSYALLGHDNGAFVGAGYTDIHWRLLGFTVQIMLLLLTATLGLAALWRTNLLKWAGVSVAIWFGAAILLGSLLPSAVQKTTVEPNLFATEQEYIRRNIAFTRKGFGLEKVRHVDNFPANENLTAAQLKTNQDTLTNVRLWDYSYLARVYEQIHTVKSYYQFQQNVLVGPPTQNIDIDRYRINGQLRQVMLGAREMNASALPKSGQNWQNRRLSYTHGYGLVMSPVNEVQAGQPTYFIEGFPPAASAKVKGDRLKVTRPELYYGLLEQGYVFVDTQLQEFDYPSTDGEGANAAQDHYTTYEGKGGIGVGSSYLAKLAFSLRLGDANLLLAKNLKPTTRVLIRRDIRERVLTLAPFLQQDSDPYLIITKEGRLIWMLDCYTLSDRFPYSTPQQVFVGPNQFIAPNYIRNSVKATVDAYDGTIQLYLSDAQDPIIRTYAKIFPGLLQPLSAMPADLREHLRYPEDLFRVQRAVYATYHVEDPRIFLLREDAWGVPIEPNLEVGATPNQSREPRSQQMEPYYIITRMPNERDEEFVLMSPLAPINREDKNILGWMCARCDGDRYGELVLYRFSQKTSINGPSQVVSLINSDREISPQLTLLRQAGSSANFGNLIVIPIEQSLLYIAPLYIESTQSARLPQLQKVVVAFGQRAVMADTLEGALARLFPGYADAGTETPPEPVPTVPGGTPATPLVVPAPIKTLIDRATTQYDAAQQRLKAGDFAAYGAALKELERTLQELRRLSGSANSPPANR